MVIDSSVFGIEKPDPAIFRAALEALNVAPEEALYVGDLYDVDVVGARAAGMEADTVVADNASGAATATRHLLAAGHRRIAFISTLAHRTEFRRGDTLSTSSVAERVEGFVETLADAGVPEPEEFVHLNARREGVERLAHRILDDDRGITAIVSSDSLIALGVFRVARALGRSIPRDLSLVAFDDADWTGVTTPGVTVMAQPIHEIGAEAARILIRRIGRRGGIPFGPWMIAGAWVGILFGNPLSAAYLSLFGLA